MRRLIFALRTVGVGGFAEWVVEVLLPVARRSCVHLSNVPCPVLPPVEFRSRSFLFKYVSSTC